MASMYQRIMDYRVGNRKSQGVEARRAEAPVHMEYVNRVGGYHPVRNSGVIDATSEAGRQAGGVQANPETLARLTAEQDRKKEEERRPKGRASTLATGGTGLLAPASVARRSLVGY